MITNAEFILNMSFSELVEWLCDVEACMKKPDSDCCGNKARCTACWISWLDKTVDIEKELKKVLKEIDFKVTMMPCYDDLAPNTLKTLDEIKQMTKKALQKLKGKERK